jgi:hypothetical protein
MGKGSGGMSGTQKGIMKREYGLKADAADYIRALEEQPLGVRGEALGGLRNLFLGDQSYQQQMIDRSMQSPLYQAIMSTQDEGEEAIMRNAAMTGGLRSGNVQEALYGYNQDLSARALLESYNQQLQGLGGLSQAQGMPSQLAGLLSGSVNLPGQGRGTSSESAWLQGFGQIAAGGAQGLATKSDKRLKTDIKKIGENKGLNIYSWTWAEVASRLYNLVGESVGYLADEVKEKFPNAVSTDSSGYLQIDYGRL